MDVKLAEQLINELFPYFEALQTQSEAIVQLLKDKGLTTDEKFAPYLEQAGKGSNVKWLAARVRIGHLLSAIAEGDAKDKEKEKKEKKEPDTDKNTEKAASEPRREPVASETGSEAMPKPEKVAGDLTVGKVGKDAPGEQTKGKRAEDNVPEDSDKPKKDPASEARATAGRNAETKAT
ncbi:MAG: hypothetical protein ACRD2U_15155 [Terriglobales bacterium]